MAKLYFISRVTCEFYRFDAEAFEVGGCFNAHAHEEQVLDVYTSKLKAERAFKKYRTHMWYSNKNIVVEEYAIVEREYDFTEMRKDFDELHTNDDCIEALKKNTWDYNDYETCYEEVLECSPRLYTGYVRWEDNTEKAKAFSNYNVACRWVEIVENSKKDKWVKSSGVELH